MQRICAVRSEAMRSEGLCTSRERAERGRGLPSGDGGCCADAGKDATAMIAPAANPPNVFLVANFVTPNPAGTVAEPSLSVTVKSTHNAIIGTRCLKGVPCIPPEIDVYVKVNYLRCCGGP